MKTLLFSLLFSCLSGFVLAQNDTTSVQNDTTYRIVTSDDSEVIGKILKQDEREVLVLTSDNRKIYIPQYVIKEISVVNTTDFNVKGEFVGEDPFATRYFITTNGLPIKKGEHYVQWNWFGPDFQFGVGKNFGVGIMTSWLGMPIIGTMKKSWALGKNTQFALGGLVGFGSWAAPDWGGALPFGTLSFGDRRANIAFSGGYGAIWTNGAAQGRGITSVAGMVKVAHKISLVFDSFIVLPGADEVQTSQYYDYSTGQNKTYTSVRHNPGLALLIPGVRWHQTDRAAFQFGFTGAITYGKFVQAPIPMVQWYRTL